MFRVLLLTEGSLGVLGWLVSNVLNAAARLLGHGHGGYTTIGDEADGLN